MPTRTSPLALAAALAVALFATHARATPSLPPLHDDVWLSVGGGAGSDDVVTQWLGTGAAALVAVPLSLVAASALGQLSNNLIVAAVPALLTFLVVPSLATALTASMLGSMGGNSTSWLAPFLGGIAVQLVMFAGAFLVGVTTTSLGFTALFALVDALALTGASVFLANTCVPPYSSASLAPPPSEPAPVKPVDVAVAPPSAVSFAPVAFRF